MSIFVVILVCFMVVIIAHELGHYFAARQLGFPVEAFQVGFGPRLLAVTDRRGTLWELRLLPIGGFVRIRADGAGVRGCAIYRHPIWARVLFFLAGPAASVALGFGLLLLSMSLFGSVAPSTFVTEATAEARAAGIEPGSRIVSIDGAPVSSAADVVAALEAYGASSSGAAVAVELTLDGASRTAKLVPRLEVLPDGSHVHRLGVTFGRMEALPENDDAAEVFRAVGAAIAGMSTTNLTGPVGIGVALDTASSGGPAALFFLVGLLSIGLGIMNLLPIPILDGGNVLLCVVEFFLGPERMSSIQEVANFVGHVLIIFLLLVVTYSDLGRI